MAGLTIEQNMRVRSALADLHDKCFTRDMKVTLVARHPTEGECHLICGDDDLAEVVKLVASKLVVPSALVGEPSNANYTAAVLATPDRLHGEQPREGGEG